MGKRGAKANWLMLGHMSRFPPFSWFSSVFASLTPGTWPEDFHRVKESFCVPLIPPSNTHCSWGARSTYSKISFKAEEGLEKETGAAISSSSGVKGGG